MPNFKHHFIAGAVVGGGASLAWQCLNIHGERNPPSFWGIIKRVDPIEVALCAVGGGLVASIPDFLEPASTPNHRAFFHSIFFGAFLIAVVLSLASWKLGKFVTFSICAAVLAYLSHLFLDSQTPRSLPFIGLRFLAKLRW